MPRGSKASYTNKQKRQTEHIEQSEKNRGKSQKASERIAWATVNKQTGGGKKRKNDHKSKSRFLFFKETYLCLKPKFY